MANTVYTRGATTGLNRTYENNKTSGTYTYTLPAADFETSEPADVIPVEGHIGLRICGINLNADGAIATARLILVHKVQIGGVTYFDLRPYALLTFTAGTMEVVDAGSNFLADTITITLDDYGTAVEAHTGRSSSKYQKANVMAVAFIPDLDNAYGFILDRNLTADTADATKFNTLHELMT